MYVKKIVLPFLHSARHCTKCAKSKLFYTRLIVLQSISEWVSSSFGSDGNKTVGTKRKRSTNKKVDHSRKATDHLAHKKKQPSPLTTGYQYLSKLTECDCGLIFILGTEVESILWSEKFSPQTVVSVLFQLYFKPLQLNVTYTTDRLN